MTLLSREAGPDEPLWFPEPARFRDPVVCACVSSPLPPHCPDSPRQRCLPSSPCLTALLPAPPRSEHSAGHRAPRPGSAACGGSAGRPHLTSSAASAARAAPPVPAPAAIAIATTAGPPRPGNSNAACHWPGSEHAADWPAPSRQPINERGRLFKSPAKALASLA